VQEENDSSVPAWLELVFAELRLYAASQAGETGFGGHLRKFLSIVEEKTLRKRFT